MMTTTPLELLVQENEEMFINWHKTWDENNRKREETFKKIFDRLEAEKSEQNSSN
jgi:hypothetical protein